MKFILITFSFLLINFLGISQVHPLEGEYSNLPHTISTAKPFDTVWNIINAIISQQGLATHSESKLEGIIVTDRFNINWTYEKKGKIKDTTAFIVVPMYHNKINETTYPEPKFHGILNAEFNITLKAENDTVTVIFNIVNVQIAVYDNKDGNTKYVPYTDYKSTGVFEKIITSYLK